MKQVINEIEINGEKYILKSSIKETVAPVNTEGMPYVIIRTYSAGVFAGYLAERTGKEVKLLKARRLWYWSGACSLSQLAVDGTKKPTECKFPCEVDSIELMEAIEVIPCTEIAMNSIKSVKIWEQ